MHAINAFEKCKNRRPPALHQKLTDYVKRFLILGGMPEVLARYSQTRDMLACQTILDDLIIFSTPVFQ